MSQRPRHFLQPLLNEREVASLLGISVRTVQDWRQSGDGPPFLKLSKRKRGAVRYDPRDVQAYVRERRVQTTDESPALPSSAELDSRIHRALRPRQR